MYKLNKAQQEAVEHTSGPLIIIAGAGTGKTTVITQKIANLIKNKGVSAENILTLAFNDKAANEILERVEEMTNIDYVDMQISTFHSFCQRILEEFGLDIGISSSFNILTQTDAWILVSKNLEKFRLNYYRPLGSPTKHIHELINHFSKCKDELISPEDYLEYANNLELDKDNIHKDEKDRLSELANTYHTYNQILLDNQSLDFGDLIYYTIELLKKRPAILKKLQDKYKYILVDEFQDVNWAQYQLVRMIAGEKPNLTVVGDDDQGIYSFRGASVYNIMRFNDDYKEAKQIILNENYRSGQNILDTAYKSIQNNNPDRLESKLKLNKKLKSKTKDKGKVIHTHKASLEEEVGFVVKEMSRLKKIDPESTWDDFAILIRANNHSIPFVAGLESAGIPYEFLSSTGLYRQKIVVDCVSFFRVVDNHFDSISMFRLLSMPILEMKENDIQKITYNAKRKSISFYEAIKRSAEYRLSSEGVEKCNKLIDLVHNALKQSRFEKPHRILLDFLENSGYMSYLAKKEDEGDREIIRDINHLRQYFEFVTKYEQNIPEAKIFDFLEQFEYLLQSGEQGSLYQPSDTPDSVNIVTIHRAKGLEFKYVFLINLVEDRFPSRRRGNGIEIPNDLIHEKLPEGDIHFQEERRLFYVAQTRAKNKLYFLSSSDYGGARAKKISRFLDELDYKAFSEINEKTGINSVKIEKNIETESDYVYEIPKTFSYSQIKSYNTCPYQYKLTSIVKLPMKQSHYFSFGNTIHNTLQEFYQRVKIMNEVSQDSFFDKPKISSNEKMITVPSIEELLKIYENKWIADWYQSKIEREKYFDNGKKMLRQFYKENEKGWTIPVALESGFKIGFGDNVLKGRIDRIDQQEDGSLHIIDYKTGKSKEKPTGEDKEQLIIYQIATSTIPQYSHIGQTKKLTLYFIKDGIQASFLANEKEVEKLRQKVITTIEKIQSRQFGATPSKHICQNCSYRDICHYKV